MITDEQLDQMQRDITEASRVGNISALTARILPALIGELRRMRKAVAIAESVVSQNRGEMVVLRRRVVDLECHTALQCHHIRSLSSSPSANPEVIANRLRRPGHPDDGRRQIHPHGPRTPVGRSRQSEIPRLASVYRSVDRPSHPGGFSPDWPEMQVLPHREGMRRTTREAQEMDEPAILLKPEEAWRMLGVGKSFGWSKLVATGLLPTVKLGRATRIPRQAVLDYAARLVEAASVR